MTTSINIAELQAQVKATVAANMERIKEQSMIAGLQATLQLEGSEALFNAKVKLATTGAQTARLQDLVDECAGMVANVPVYNQKTRTNRVWSASRKFTYGNQIDLMYQLATGILYACAEHKALLLAHTGLSLELLEQIVQAFGSPMYYSRNYHAIVEAKPFTLELVKSTVEVMQSELSVVVDTTALTMDNFLLEFVKAKTTANNNFTQATEAIQEADFTL
jgi:hypothetical protein